MGAVVYRSQMYLRMRKLMASYVSGDVDLTTLSEHLMSIYEKYGVTEAQRTWDEMVDSVHTDLIDAGERGI